MNPPTVLLISYHFHPSNEVGARRPTTLAQFLASKGVRVVVVSAFEGRQVEPESEILPGVIAIPVRRPAKTLINAVVSLKASTLPAEGGASADGRVLSRLRKPRSLVRRIAASLREIFFRAAYFVDDYKQWGWRAAQAAIRAGKKYDARLVLASAPPHTALLASAWTARSLGIPHIADLRDPWTDFLPLEFPDRRLELRLLHILEGWVMRSAAAITSTGATVAESLARRYRRTRDKIHVIRNGYDGDLQRASTDTGGRLAILFAGELYAGRNPFPLLSALETVLGRADLDASRISLTFVGRVAEYDGQPIAPWLQDKRCAAVVRLLPSMPQQAVTQMAKDSTVLLNLAQRQPLSVPAKTYEHLASGRENLLISENDSETSLLVRGIAGVVQVDEDVGALERALLDLYHRHAVLGRLTAPAEQDVVQFARASANHRFWTLIQEIAGLEAQSSSARAATTP